MAFYDLTPAERRQLVKEIGENLYQTVRRNDWTVIVPWFDVQDTYIRKAAYVNYGRIWQLHPQLHSRMLDMLEPLLVHDSFRVRQTAINAAGEIGKTHFELVHGVFDKGLFDAHHSPRNAVIGSIKKMGEVNPVLVLRWAENYLQHPDKEIRREICHGIELRGRTHPQDVLPLLKQLQFDPTKRVSTTLVHVIGQIAYKKGCLETVLQDLKTWENQELVVKALEEIVDVHRRYAKFAVLTVDEVIKEISRLF